MTTTHRSRIERLEAAASPPRLAVVMRGPDETEDDAIARHLAERPEDAGASLVVVITGVSRAVP